MRHPNPDMLLYIAMADAYAMCAEFVEGEAHRDVLASALLFEHYLPHPTFAEYIAGRFTDDTEMSIANAKRLIAGPPYINERFANAYVDEFAIGKRRRGYASGLYDLLSSVTSGKELVARLRPQSSRNGAAMRAMVLGVIPHIDTLLRVSETQARITHDTPEGIFSSHAVALMAHFALYEEAPLREVGRYVLRHLPKSDARKWGHAFAERWSGAPVAHDPSRTIAETTVHAVAHLVMHQESLMDIMKTALSWGGDTDSVAAIAWGIASARYQSEVLPQFLYDELEPGYPETGTLYLRDIGTRLMAKYAS